MCVAGSSCASGCRATLDVIEHTARGRCFIAQIGSHASRNHHSVNRHAWMLDRYPPGLPILNFQRGLINPYESHPIRLVVPGSAISRRYGDRGSHWRSGRSQTDDVSEAGCGPAIVFVEHSFDASRGRWGTHSYIVTTAERYRRNERGHGQQRRYPSGEEHQTKCDSPLHKSSSSAFAIAVIVLNRRNTPPIKSGAIAPYGA
jgi:hypothetical protein